MQDGYIQSWVITGLVLRCLHQMYKHTWFPELLFSFIIFVFLTRSTRGNRTRAVGCVYLILDVSGLIPSHVFLYVSGFILNQVFLYVSGLGLKPLSHQSGVLTAFPQRSKKMQVAEVRAVQSPPTLCGRCVIA